MLYIIFAAYNEEQVMPDFMANIKSEIEKLQLEYTVIACTDASTDNTAKIIESYNSTMPVKLLPQTQERGLGVAFRRTLKAVCDESTSDEDIAIFLDADCTHNLEYSASMIAKIHSGNDVVIASRFAPGSTVSGFPPHRMLFSYGASFFFRILFPIKGVKDYTSGYRAYKITILKKAHEYYGHKFIEENDFCCSPEVVLKLRKIGAKFSEVPFSYRYDLKLGASKMNIKKFVTSILKMSWRLLMK